MRFGRKDHENRQEPIAGNPPFSGSEVAPKPQGSSKVRGNVRAFFTRPLLSKKRTDELTLLVSESDKIHARLAETEDNLRKIIRQSAEWDRKFTKEFHLFKKAVAEELIGLGNDVSKQTELVKQSHDIALGRIASACGQISGIDGTIGGIRDYLAKSADAIRRYQEGYDFQILKNFVRQIARAISDLDRSIGKASDEAKPALIEAKEDLIELLYRNGVEPILPEVGISYKGMEKYAEVSPEKVPAINPAQRGGIAVVTRLGYKYTFDTDKERVIQPAMVKLYE